MYDRVKLSEVAEVVSGQILKRVTADGVSGEEGTLRRVIVPKAIQSDGEIKREYITEETFARDVDERRITKSGDIVIKLSTPYDSAVITRDEEGCVVPSFCAVIRHNPEKIELPYLQAFLSGSVCKDQLKKMIESMGGASTALLTIGKIGELLIPMPLKETREKIGEEYLSAKSRIVLMKKIIEGEREKVDIMFKEL